MVGEPVGQGIVGEAEVLVEERLEIEKAAPVVGHVDELLFLALREPGDLVVELVARRIVGIGEDRPRDRVQFFGNGEARVGEGLPELAALAIDVEVDRKDRELLVRPRSWYRSGLKSKKPPLL